VFPTPQEANEAVLMRSRRLLRPCCWVIAHDAVSQRPGQGDVQLLEHR
jgi:hypothetical protein